MAVASGVTEIPDSEDEPFTSSPDVAFGGAADKLCATSRGAAQDAQDVANPDQAATEHIGNDTESRSDDLGVDQGNASTNDQASVQTAGALSQLHSTISTPDKRCDLVPQAQTASLNAEDANTQTSLEPVAGRPEQCMNGVDAGSTDQTEAILGNTDAPDGTHKCPEYDPPSGLVKGNQLDPINRHVEQYNAEAADNGADDNGAGASMEIDQTNEPPTLSVSDAVNSSSIQNAVPAVEASTNDVQPQASEENGCHDAKRPVTDHAATSPARDITSGELEPGMQDLDFETEMSEKPQTSITTSLQNEDNAEIEGVQTREEDHDSIPLFTSQDANGTLQSFDDPATIVETTQPTAATESSVSTSSQPPKVHEQPAGVPVPVAESPSDEAEAMDCTEPEPDENKTEQQSFADGNQRPLDNSSLDVNPDRGMQPSVLVGEGLTEDGNEKQAVNTAGVDISTAAANTTSAEQSTIVPSPPAPTPQEITLAELKAQKASLLASLATLPAIRGLMEGRDSLDVDMSDGEPTEANVMAAVNKIVKNHIKLLHEYNELKDTGQGLMGLIADQRGVRIVEVQDEFGIDAND